MRPPSETDDILDLTSALTKSRSVHFDLADRNILGKLMLRDERQRPHRFI
ncbi:uncharacterized protein FFC1_01948 [Fusarium fujikuroi]|nr:uncharacterized protein FFC1_01948 [Fusarium fujikuroi]